MDLPTLIILTSAFSILGVLGGIYRFCSNSGRTFCEQTVRVATVREKVLENEKFSRSGKSQGITFSVREI